METNRHAFIARTHVRLGLYALALLGVSLTAQAATVGGQVFIGNDLTTAADLGRMWQRTPELSSPKVYYNYAPTMEKSNGNLVLRGGTYVPQTGGYKLPVQMTTTVGRGAMFGRFAAAFSGPVGTAAFIGLPFLLQWLGDAGVSPNPDQSDPSKKWLLRGTQDGWEYAVANYSWQPSRDAACRAYATEYTAAGAGNSASNPRLVSHPTYEYVCWVDYAGPGGNYSAFSLLARRTAQAGVQWPASMDDIRPYMEGANVPTGALPELLGLPGPGIESTSTVTGPGTSPSQTTSSTSARTETKPGLNGQPVTSTITTVTNNTQHITNNYEGNKITTTITTTTTTTTTTNTPKQNPDGSPVLKPDGTPDTTTTTDTDTKTEDKDPKPDEGPDLCEKYPDILACAKPELDTPDGEVPKEDRNVSFEPEDVFGTGSCPANLTTHLTTIGRDVTVWDWQRTCELALPLRALIIGLASFAAFLIVMPGETRT